MGNGVSPKAYDKEAITRHNADVKGISLGAVPSHITKDQGSFQFYAGISGGVDRMTGHRNESVFNAADDTTNNFASNRAFSDKNAQYSVFGGTSFNMSSLPLFFGPEFYLGRSHATNELREIRSDLPTTPMNRTLQASIQNRYFFGAIIRAGVNLPEEFQAFILFGFDKSQIRYAAFYTPRSAFGFGGINDEPSSYFAIMKWSSSAVWGFGIEKTIYNKFRLGADIRFLDSFKKFQFSSGDMPSGNPAGPDILTSFFNRKNLRFSLRITYLF